MKSGTCPKCEGTNVFEGSGIPFCRGSQGAAMIPVNLFSVALLDNYVCIDCGYVESYVHDRAKREKIAEKWPRVRPAEAG